jgi:hypothetical protein
VLAENAIYKEHFTKRRLRLTDAQRRRLAVKGKALGRVIRVQLALASVSFATQGL